MNSLTAELSASSHIGSPWNVNLQLINPSSSQDINVFSFQTPLDQLTACRAFSVFDTTEAKYLSHVGPIYKRHSSHREHQINFEKNSRREVEVDLSECYEFEAGHSYQVSLSDTTTFKHTNGHSKVRLANHLNEYYFTADSDHHPNPKVITTMYNIFLLFVVI